MVITMYVLIQWTVDKELVKYINIREQQMLTTLSINLSERYQEVGNWSFIARQPRRFHEIIRQIDGGLLERKPIENRPLEGRPPAHRPPPKNHRRSSLDSRPPPPPPRGEPNLAVLTSLKQVVVGRYSPKDDYSLSEIKHGSETIGWLAIRNMHHPVDDFDLALQEALTGGFLLVSALVIILSSIFSFPLTRFIVRRVTALAEGAKAVSNGDFSHRVVVNSRDEIGGLGRDFNHLAQTLEQNESARKRWIADISHELRTPLAITSGELEAMEDGVRPLSLENVKSARDEIKHLQRLVNDLYELTNADIGAISYHKTSLNLAEMVHTEGQHFTLLAEEHGLVVRINIAKECLLIQGDETRLKQLIQNILGNSIKYSDAPGEIYMALKVGKKNKQHMAKLVIEDSAPGVDAQNLEKLFDHLYRVEDSRNRKTGGSGLGLAICKQIVLAHQGQMHASASRLGGLKVSIYLPLV